MRRVFRKIVLISFLSGCIFRFIDYRAWMPLRNYTVKAESPALEQRLWDVLSSRYLAFWPRLYFGVDSLSKYLENDIPATVTTTMVSIGRFVTVMKWRVPWLRVQWHGEIWCVSRDGYMWSVSELSKLEGLGNAFSSEIAKTWNEGPIWHLPQLLDFETSSPQQEGETHTPSGVIKSVIPVKSIESFMDEYEQCSWFKMIKSITMGRRAGFELFTLELENGAKQRFEILLQREKYANQDLGVTIEQVLSDLVREGGNHLIDATYEGKFVLQPLPDRPKEGMN